MAKNRQRLAISILAASLAAVLVVIAHAQASDPVPGPVPATGNADCGKDVYVSHCAQCHGEDLQGTSFGDGTPALKRDDFLAGRDPQAVFAQMRRAMPFNAPGSLSDKEYADVFAYLVRVNRAKALNDDH